MNRRLGCAEPSGQEPLCAPKSSFRNEHVNGSVSVTYLFVFSNRVYTMLLEKRERFPGNLFCFFSSATFRTFECLPLWHIAASNSFQSLKHFISTVKHLKPASAVMLFPPTNPFLVLSVCTFSGSFYMGKSKQMLESLSFLFLGSWLPELLCKAEMDIIVALCLSSSYPVLPLSFTALTCCRNISDPS